MVNRLSLLANSATNSLSGPTKESDVAPLSVGVVIGIVICAIGAVSLSVVLVWWIQAKLRGSPEDEKFLDQLSGLPPRFAYKDLETATKHFSVELGSGGFGSVYEGTLANGVKVAVKRLHNKEKGSKDFRAEVATVGGIHHENLVRLQAFCAEGPVRLLVYEFVPNASLDKWLFMSRNVIGEETPDDIQPQQHKVLDWGQRFVIALGTARGVAYLHDDCTHRILHLDIKPQNILLDAKFEPKVADFGLSKLTNRQHSAELTVTTMRGTPGYVAPEWMLGVGITEKGDVYSYGMVLFEILSGRPNIDSSLSESVSFHFPAFATKVVRDVGYGHGCLIHLVDPNLDGSFDAEQATRLLKVAMWCIQEVPKYRPHMREVVLMLDGKLSIPDPPLMKFSGLLQAQQIMKEYYEAQQTLSREQIEKVHSFDSPDLSSVSTGTSSEVSAHSSISVG